MKTTIKAKKNLYNRGKCFTKEKEYSVDGLVKTESELAYARTVNDQSQPHIIGSWWKDFVIVSNQS